MAKRFIVLLYVNSVIASLFVIGVLIYISQRFVQITLPLNFTNGTVAISSQNPFRLLYPLKGYSLRDCEKTGVSIPVKKNWYFNSEHIGPSRVCYLSVESMKNEGSFKTGITIQIIQDYAYKTQIPEKEYAFNYVKEYAGLELDAQIHEANYVDLIAYSTSITLPNEELDSKQRKHITAIANTRMHTLYLIYYETPLGEEATHRDEINTMISHIYLDAGY